MTARPVTESSITLELVESGYEDGEHFGWFYIDTQPGYKIGEIDKQGDGTIQVCVVSE